MKISEKESRIAEVLSQLLADMLHCKNVQEVLASVRLPSSFGGFEIMMFNTDDGRLSVVIRRPDDLSFRLERVGTDWMGHVGRIPDVVTALAQELRFFKQAADNQIAYLVDEMKACYLKVV